MSFLSFCGSLYPILKLVKSVLTLLQIAVPIALIVFGSIDMAKAVIAGKEDEMKKAQSILLKRFIYACAIFLIFTIVTLVMNLIADVAPTDPEGNPLDVNSWRNCWNCKSKAECDAIGEDIIDGLEDYEEEIDDSNNNGDTDSNSDSCEKDGKNRCYYSPSNSSYSWGYYEGNSDYVPRSNITTKEECLGQ